LNQAVTDGNLKSRTRRRGKGERFSVEDDGEGIAANYALDAATLNQIAERERLVDVPMCARPVVEIIEPIVNRPIDIPSPVALVSGNLVNEDAAPYPSPAVETRNNREQSGSNPVANQQQTESNPIANSIANREQSGSNPVAKPKQRGKLIDSNPIANSIANREQEFGLIFLRGLQRVILDFLFSECCFENSLTTRPVQGRELQKLANGNLGVAKNARDRLAKKGYIAPGPSSSGPLGATIYELPKWVYDALLRDQRAGLIGSNPIANSIASAPVVVSSLKSNTTTTEIPVEWLSIKSPLSWFGRSQKETAYKSLASKYRPDELQDSLEAYAWDLSHKKVGPKNVSAFLMGIIVKGNLYGASDDYLRKDDKAPVVLDPKVERDRLQAEADKRSDEQNAIYEAAFQARHHDAPDPEEILGAYAPPFMSDVTKGPGRRLALGSWALKNGLVPEEKPE